jgi:peptidoglycan/xylan/chitin deacetylase (PgdA/CDA1 family)
VVALRLRIRQALDEAGFRLGRDVPVAVFMYHSVTPDAEMDWGPWKYSVTPETFERQLARITDQYDVRPLADIVISCQAGSPPTRPTAAITFDDGFRDNLTAALPILERYDAPATVYVAGKYLDGKAPYEYRLATALQSASRVAVDAAGTRIERSLTDEQSRREAYEKLRRELKFARSDVRETAVTAIDGEGTGPAMLTSDTLRDLAASSLVDIGAHGYEHVPLTALDGDALGTDLDRAKSTLEAVLSEPVTLFSYPYGDHSDAVVQAVERAGFESAVTTVPRRVPASRFRASPYRIPRYDGAA